MKIRLQSIKGRVADPLYNLAKMEEAIRRAKKDEVDLLVFPSDSIASYNLGSIEKNEDFVAARDEAYSKIYNRVDGMATSGKMKIAFHDRSLSFKDFEIEIDSEAELESVEKSFRRGEIAKANSFGENHICIVCKGKGTEPATQGVYSNAKIVAVDGKIIVNDFDQDVVDVVLGDVAKRFPYFPNIDTWPQDELDAIYSRIIRMQGEGLIAKLESMNRHKICLGVSGGLDSAVSLVACAKAFKDHGLPLTDIIAVTMPGLGTTKRTYDNAYKLMKSLGVTIEEIDLRPILKEHLKNISQPEGKFDVTYEQCQSRERTQVLLDIANRDNAVMIGTGCMSEFALGWMTYGGDHLSMYAINVGLPKSMVKAYARWISSRFEEEWGKDLCDVVRDIVEGPVSPELLPIDDKGEQHEKTESIIGDYAVLDFWIYHIVKDGWGIRKLFEKAKETFYEYDEKKLFGWLKTFCLRFFTRQYKKNCYGDGLQLLDWSVSPFTGFQMPSDVGDFVWKAEIDKLEKELEEKA